MFPIRHDWNFSKHTHTHSNYQSYEITIEILKIKSNSKLRRERPTDLNYILKLFFLPNYKIPSLFLLNLLRLSPQEPCRLF